MSIQGYTQKNLASKIGIHPSSLKRKITGETEFSLDEIAKISELLQKTIDYLFVKAE
jgi:transcriptional regulator with XRE-family HTH domain